MCSQRTREELIRFQRLGLARLLLASDTDATAWAQVYPQFSFGKGQFQFSD